MACISRRALRAARRPTCSPAGRRTQLPVYGKTGTAERGVKQDQSWYVAYVNHPKHPIVVVATVEEGGFGAATAAPIACQMLAKFYDLKNVPCARGESGAR